MKLKIIQGGKKEQKPLYGLDRLIQPHNPKDPWGLNNQEYELYDCSVPTMNLAMFERIWKKLHGRLFLKVIK